MKKIILLIFIWIGCSESFAEQSNSTTINPVNETVVEKCQQYDGDQKNLEENSAFYYFMTGICRLNFIHDNASFNEVVERLNKSVSINGNSAYPYFILGDLFEAKYRSGSLFYGAKGAPQDLIQAIKNYEKAADLGSSLAQNNLAEIYLNEINISGKNQTKDSWDVKNDKAPVPLPDVNKAIFWLTKAAKNGNTAAQGTLSDLYRQGIGVPQNYVLAYVWENLSVASWVRLNVQPFDKMAEENLKWNQRDRDALYENLTQDQKTEAMKLLEKYEKSYFVMPSEIDLGCFKIQSSLSSLNIEKLMNGLSR